MEKLKELFDFLTSKPTNSVEIWDVDNDIKLESKNYRPNLSSYDAFRAEIKQLLNSHNRIGLQKYYMNGNASVKKGAMKHIIQKKHTDVDRGGVASNPLPSQHQFQNNNGMNGMLGNASQGLGFAEMGKLANFDEVKADRNKYQAECDKLKEKNKELETEILKLTFGKESKPGTVEKLLDNPEVLTQLATVLGQAISKGSSAAQLPQGASMNAPQLSQIKQKFIADFVQMDPDDSVVMRLVYLLKSYLEGNKEVINEFEKLYSHVTNQHQSK